MAEYNKTSFETYYGTTGTTFADNTTGDISALDMRTFGKDISDSFDGITKFITASGTDTYTGSIASNPTIATGLKIFIKFTNANTGASTFNLNSSGAVTLRTHDGTALASGNIAAGSVWLVVYDGSATQWRLMGPVSASGGTISGLTTNRIPYATGATTLGDDANFVYDTTNKALTISNTGTTIKVHTGGSGGSLNVFIGQSAGNFTMTGNYNSALGCSTLDAITSGNYNTGIGYESGGAITSGSLNTAIGYQALFATVSSIRNTGVGGLSMGAATGSYNTGLGYLSGYNVTSGNYNVAIGHSAYPPSATNDGQLSIQNAIYGTGNTSTDTTISSGNIGFWATSWGTSASKVLAWSNGTAPSTSTADAFQMYSADITAGNAAPHIRTEAGHIIKLYTANSGSAYSISNGTTDRTFDANATTVEELADALYTLIEDLKLTGLIA